MSCLYKYEGTQGEGLEVMQALRDVYIHIYCIYIYIVFKYRDLRLEAMQVLLVVEIMT